MNTQKFTTIDKGKNRQITSQRAHTLTTSRTTGAGAQEFHRSLRYALTVNTLKQTHTDGSSIRIVSLHQMFDKRIELRTGAQAAYRAHVSNVRDTEDAATFNTDHTGLVNNGKQTSAQRFAFTDSLGDCYRGEVNAQGGKVTAFSQGRGCLQDGMKMKPTAHPDGSPQ